MAAPAVVAILALAVLRFILVVPELPSVTLIALTERGPGKGVLLSRTETLLLALLATAKSGFPSPLKSPTVKKIGLVPTAKFVAPPKLPVPVPKRIERL